MTWPTTMQAPDDRPGIQWRHARCAATRHSPAYGPLHAFRRRSMGLKGAYSLCGAIKHHGEEWCIGTFHYCVPCIDALGRLVGGSDEFDDEEH